MMCRYDYGSVKKQIKELIKREQERNGALYMYKVKLGFNF